MRVSLPHVLCARQNFHDAAFGSVEKLVEKELDQYFPNTDFTLVQYHICSNLRASGHAGTFKAACGTRQEILSIVSDLVEFCLKARLNGFNI